MKLDIFNHIKKSVSIVDVAEHYGAQPYGHGDPLYTKVNPLRDDDDTSSLFLYQKTNSFFDFGTKTGGSVIDFIMSLKGCTAVEAVNELATIFGLPADGLKETDYKPTKFLPAEKPYLSPLQINEILADKRRFREIELYKDREAIETITPLEIYKTANPLDVFWYTNRLKYSNEFNTPVALPLAHDGSVYTLRYRYKQMGGEIKKWVALAGTRANYLYTRITDNPSLLIVEGTRDYLNGGLLGYSVIALPHANFKELPKELTEGKKLIFIDDNDGKNSMAELFDNTKGDKFWFRHDEFCEMNGIEVGSCKDLSDYLYKFDSVESFKNALSKLINEGHGLRFDIDKDFNRRTPTTLKALYSMPEAEALIENFIYKGTSTVLHSAPGRGKSVFVLSMVKKLLGEGKVKEVFYFDGDNSPTVLRDRLINFGQELESGKLLYYSTFGMTIEQMLEMIDELGNDKYKGQGRDKLIIVDTLGRFLNAHTAGKGSISSDKDVAPLIEKIDKLAKNLGSTVILIHHSNKATDDKGKPVFSGSHRITSDTDGTWGLDRNIETGVISLYSDKARFPGIPPYLEVKIDLDEYKITSIEAKELTELNGGLTAKEKKQIKKIVSVIEYLYTNKETPFTAIAKAVGCHHTEEKRERLKTLIKLKNRYMTTEEKAEIVNLLQKNPSFLEVEQIKEKLDNGEPLFLIEENGSKIKIALNIELLELEEIPF